MLLRLSPRTQLQGIQMDSGRIQLNTPWIRLNTAPCGSVIKYQTLAPDPTTGYSNGFRAYSIEYASDSRFKIQGAGQTSPWHLESWIRGVFNWIRPEFVWIQTLVVPSRICSTPLPYEAAAFSVQVSIVTLFLPWRSFVSKGRWSSRNRGPCFGWFHKELDHHSSPAQMCHSTPRLQLHVPPWRTSSSRLRTASS